MKLNWISLGLGSVLVTASACGAEAPAKPANYARPVEPMVAPAFLPLPPGAVEPAGWLGDWAKAARDGITGHLDERHAVFHDGWKGPAVAAPHADPDGTGWPLEQSAYWLDGALRLGFILHDEALIAKIRARLDPIVDGVLAAPDPTSFIYWKKDYEPKGFNGWAHSQLGRALVALYQGTGDKRVLAALVKVYAQYPVKMGGAKFTGVSGLCNLDAMLETYSYSGDKRILEHALAAAAQPGVVQQWEAWRHGQITPGHMVITYEDIRLPALVFPWTGQSVQLEASLAACHWLDDGHMLPYGVASGEEWASGVGALRKTETCDVTAMLLASSWLYRVNGDGDWGDRMEQAFFNAAAAPVARDFETMCYYQSPNRLRSDALPCEQPHSPGKGGLTFGPLGCPTVLCCVGAVNRIIPSYVMHMWMGTADNGLAATLYGPSVVNALAGDHVKVRIATTTDYPFGETIGFRVDPETTAKFPLYLRIPAWCEAPQLRVNGRDVAVKRDGRDFVCIARKWRAGDRVELQLPMHPTVERGAETEFPKGTESYFAFEPKAVFTPRRLPYASVSYGPLLFALPVADIDANTPDPKAKWAYALDLPTGAEREAIKVHRSAMPSPWAWPLAAPITLTVPARSFDWQPSDAQALPDQPVTGGEKTTITLVPYGCTKFRISMFPVSAQMSVAPVVAKQNPTEKVTEPDPLWDLNVLQKTPAAQWGLKQGLAQQVYYEGEPRSGHATRVFAYYAHPPGRGPFPAVVLVHGGGGTAFKEWAELWARHGYAALAMDLAGAGPGGPLKDGISDGQDDAMKTREFAESELREMWTYQAVAAVIRGHSLLRAQPEVDPDRVALTGISWGGYLACIIAGVDHRFKAVVPVYGCGFIYEDSVWSSRFVNRSAEQRDRWVEHFDPSRYLARAECPMLFVDGTNDPAYPLDSLQKSYDLVKTPVTLAVEIERPHSHIWTFREVDAFIDSVVRDGRPLPKLSAAVASKTDISAHVSGPRPLKSAELAYTIDSGPWPKRHWQRVPATIDRDGRVAAPMPVPRPRVAYLTVTDQDGLTVSTAHFELP